MNYCVDGNGPPLLMIHGFGISFSIWKFLLSYLRPHFTLLIVELPGIGTSPLQDRGHSYLDEAAFELEKIRELLEIKRWNILSYSSGTRVAERYIQLYPGYIERVVFLCPAQISLIRAFSLQMAIQLDCHLPHIGNWVLSSHRLKFLIDLLGFNLEKNTLSQSWFAEISSQPLNVLKATLRSLPEYGRRPFWIPNEIPRLFVWGLKDLIIEVPLTLSLHDCVIQARHSAPQTAAKEVFDVIFPFLLLGRDK